MFGDARQHANIWNKSLTFLHLYSLYTSILSLLSVPVKGSVQHISSGSVKSIILLRGDKSYIVVSSHSGWTWWTSLTRTPPPRKNTSLGHLNTKKRTVSEFGNSKRPNFPRSSKLKLTIPFVSRHLGWVDIILCWRVHLNPQDSLMLHFYQNPMITTGGKKTSGYIRQWIFCQPLGWDKLWILLLATQPGCRNKGAVTDESMRGLGSNTGRRFLNATHCSSFLV